MDVRRETTGEYEREAMTNIVDAKDLMHEYVRRDEEGNIEETLMALDHLNLTVKPGKFIAVLGHNGSGKSTFAKHVNALLEPTGGSLWVNGMDVTDEENIFAIRQSAGMVFQNPDNQIIASVVQEDVGFGPENIGVPTDEIWERVEKSLKAVGMWEYREHSPNKLSGGQKQRVAIAGVMAMEPKCIVLDEPTAMLDPDGRKEVLEAVHELNRSKGVTVILITHYMEEVVDADYVFVMDQGKVVMEGEPREIFSHVQELKSHRLDVPQITLLAHELKEAGMDLPDGILTRKELIAAIKEAVGKKHVGAQAE
ncbi:MAG: energy-coupling factor transporter ATPase [Oscillospiraceae bacterium]